jgi:hypothetical protein
MNRAMYPVTPTCPKCWHAFAKTATMMEKLREAPTSEFFVTCPVIYSAPGDPVVKRCGWKGIIAFFMTDKTEERLDDMADDHRTAMERMES